MIAPVLMPVNLISCVLEPQMRIVVCFSMGEQQWSVFSKMVSEWKPKGTLADTEQTSGVFVYLVPHLL